MGAAPLPNSIGKAKGGWGKEIFHLVCIHNMKESSVRSGQDQICHDVIPD